MVFCCEVGSGSYSGHEVGEVVGWCWYTVRVVLEGCKISSHVRYCCIRSIERVIYMTIILSDHSRSNNCFN